MQSEESRCVAGGLRRHLLGRSPQGACDRVQDVGQERGLVAARLGLRPEVPRREVGRIGLQQQAVEWNVAHQLDQVPAAALVADPAGNADVEAKLEVRVQLGFLAGEAMRYGLARSV